MGFGSIEDREVAAYRSYLITRFRVLVYDECQDQGGLITNLVGDARLKRRCLFGGWTPTLPNCTFEIKAC